MKRIFYPILIGAVLYLLIGVADHSRVRATQCYDPGCCAPTLVYNQWSCQQASNCKVIVPEDERYPVWYCPGTGERGGTTFEECMGVTGCTGDCTEGCPQGWARKCQITEGSSSCTDDDLCQTTINLKQCENSADANDCSETTESDTRGCWVLGGGSPSPSPPPEEGRGCGASCSDLDPCISGLTCAADTGSGRVCWGDACGGGGGGGPTPTPLPPPTAPTNLQCVVPTVQSSADFSYTGIWNTGLNGNLQLMRMDIDDSSGRNDANYGCPSGGGQDPGVQTVGVCVTRDDAVGASTTSFPFQENLMSGQTYYWRAVNIQTTTGLYADATSTCRTCPVKTNPVVGVPACDNMTSTGFRVNFTPATSGTTNYDIQQVRVDINKSNVDDGCMYGCAYKNDNLPTSAASDLATGLTPGNDYWVRIVGLSTANPVCWKDAEWQCRLPGGNIQGRAVVIPDDQPTCAATYISSTYLDQTQISFSPVVNPAIQAQNSNSYATWNNVFATTYTISAVPPDAGWVQRISCWTQEGGTPSSGTGNSAALEDTRTLSWDMGYSPPGPWWQAVGGDVYGKNGIVSAIPTTILPRAFNINGIGEYPGVVTMGSSSYDFAVENFGGDPNGRKLVNALDDPLPNTKNWLATGETMPQDGTNLYSLYYTRFGSPTSPTFGGGAKPTSGVYYASGDVAVDQDWVLGANDSIVIFVNGTLTIKNSITNPTGTGFVVFITSSGITVDSSVGGAYNSNTATIEGVYITSGILDTSLGAVGKERLIAKGIFLANSVKLSRNLKNAGGGIGQNINYPAQQFIYDPGYLVRMPASMTEIAGSTTWQEVAP